MTALHACDVTLNQTHMGTTCFTTFTWLSDKTTGLTLGDITALAGELLAEFVPLLHALQSDWVYTYGMHLQARGTTVPSLDFLVNSYAEKDVPDENILAPEFNYWLRHYVGATLKSIPGTADTDHPIRRGGAYIVGADDRYLHEGIYTIPAGDVALWDALSDFLATEFVIGGVAWQGAVLGEQIVDGTGWRVAPIEGSVTPHMTRLRSRKS